MSSLVTLSKRDGASALTVADRFCMSIIDISPKQSLGPRMATRMSRPEPSPSWKIVSPGLTRIVFNILESRSSTSSLSAPNRPISRSVAIVSGDSCASRTCALVAFEGITPNSIRLERAVRSGSRTSGEALHEHDAAPAGSGVVLDLLHVPTERHVKSDRALGSRRGDRFHSHTSRRAAVLRETIVKEPSHAAPPIVGVDADEVDVADARPGLLGSGVRGAGPRSEKAQEKPDHQLALFDDERLSAELVEEDGMRERADRPAPPVIDDLDDPVEAAFCDAADIHGQRARVASF